MKSNSIKSKETIDQIKQYFINKNSFAYDRHLLFFVLGINLCLKPKDLIVLAWNDIICGDIVKDYIDYNSYMFYINSNCKDIIYWYINKYPFVLNSDYIFAGSYLNDTITYAAINKMYSRIQKELELNFEFSLISLHKTFVYWQLVSCHRDYVKMSKLRNIIRKEKDTVNDYAEYNVYDDGIYINDVNL